MPRTMTPRDAYEQLQRDCFELDLIRSTASTLGWDEQTQLPARGTPHRAEQLAFLGKLAHERFTSPRIGELIATVGASDLVNDGDVAANVGELRRAFDRATKMPSTLVEAQAKHVVLAQQAWVEARKASDFKSFAPWLAQTLALKREEAACVGTGGHPYDALLYEYEPHETTEGVRVVLDGLRERLVPLVQRVLGSTRRAPTLSGEFPVDAQAAFGAFAAARLGFDFDAGRLDVSVHPFCTGLAAGDTRLTTRYSADAFDGSFFGVLHETGHGLYEQGLPKVTRAGQPLAEAISLGIHESQSRMWENLVGRSPAFWRFFGPLARERFAALRAIDDDTLIRAMNAFAPSFVRVEADELTYNLHILVRFELETRLIADELDVSDVPAAWNELMRNYLGIAPPDDRRGCLQDVHWAAGLIGYFPTYTLGNLYASQFFDRAMLDLGDQSPNFARGDFAPLLAWLRDKIHRHGRRYTAAQLVERVTGSALSSDALIKHLTAKVDTYY